jgi:hypothetical protein
MNNREAILTPCPSCKQAALHLNGDRYECLNDKCGDSFFKVSVDRYYENVAADQRALRELHKKNTKAWVGNQYYDGKRWRAGPYHRTARNVNLSWIWWLLLLAGVSFIGTIILDYFQPGSTITFFGLP